MTTYTLDIETNYEFDLIGISSHEKNYRLVWSLNKCMGWNLRRIEDISMNQRGGDSLHAQFRFFHPTEHSIITLIDNKTPVGFFLPDVQHFDYVLKIDDDQFGCDDAFFKKLRNNPFIITAHPLDVDKLKSKQNLLYEYR